MIRTETTAPRLKPLFYGLLALLVCAPLPLGSNRAWAWAITNVWAVSLLAIWIGLHLAGRMPVPPVFRQARWALGFGACWVVLAGLQCLPLPSGWIEVLSPKAHAIHARTAEALGVPAGSWSTISVDPHASRHFLYKSVAYASVFVLVLLLVDSRRRVELLLKTLVFSGTLQALYGSFMVLSGLEYGFFHPKTIGQGVATGTFVNRNHLAGYLNLCLAAGMGLMIAKLGGGSIHTLRQFLRSIVRLLLSEKTRLRIYLIIMVIGLVLTRSRMGNTAFFAGILFVGAIGLLLMRHAPRSTTIFLASVVALDLLVVGTWFGVEQVAERIGQTKVHASASDVLPQETRDEVDRYTLNYARDYWLTGSGGGTYYVAFPAYANRDVVGFYDHAHNDYLQFLAETGVLGVTCGGAVVLMSAALALRALRQRRDPLMRGTAFAVVLALCWAAIHSTVDFNLQIPAVAMTLVVFLALAWIALYLSSARARHAP